MGSIGIATQLGRNVLKVNLHFSSYTGSIDLLVATKTIGAL